jgi:hypothetical protein
MKMKMTDVILMAITVAAIIIIVRTIMYMPIMQGAIERFVGSDASGGPINSLTECPAGSQIYFYNGVVYCCSGIVDPDADTVQRSCKPAAGAKGDRMFCTLGPNRNGVVNCLDTLGGIMEVRGESICPPSLPNFCQGPAGSATAAGRCCASSPNAAYTDCTGGPSCDAKNKSPNIFTDPTDCRFKRAAETDTQCPANYSQALIPGTNGLGGITLIGCSNGTSSICYTDNILNQLKALGFTVSSLNACSSISS